MTHVKHSHIWFGLGLSMITLGASCVDSADAVDDEQVGTSDDEIVGGANTTIDQHPHQVMITSLTGGQFCGGSILNASWVATAQHCVAGGNSNMRVVAGTTRRSQQALGQIRTIDALTTAPGFTDPTTGKDVALLHVTPPLDLSGPNARAIPLVTLADAAAGATNGGVISTVTGWGTLSSGGGQPDILQTVDVPLVTNPQATAAYGFTISADQLGAGVLGVGGKDSCQGDSGGPLTVVAGGVRKLAGVVSWGNGCALAAFPGLYARVSEFNTYISDRANGVFASTGLLTGLSGARNVFSHRTVTVPPGTRALSAIIRGGTGDADLYVRFNAAPTTGAFQCRPFLGGNNEFCTIDSPAAGTWFVSLRGFSAYTNSSLVIAIVTP